MDSGKKTVCGTPEPAKPEPTADEMMGRLNRDFEAAMMMRDYKGTPIFNEAGRLIGLYRAQCPRIEKED